MKRIPMQYNPVSKAEAAPPTTRILCCDKCFVPSSIKTIFIYFKESVQFQISQSAFCITCAIAVYGVEKAKKYNAKRGPQSISNHIPKHIPYDSHAKPKDFVPWKPIKI
jgi:hypothetical protein